METSIMPLPMPPASRNGVISAIVGTSVIMGTAPNSRRQPSTVRMRLPNRWIKRAVVNIMAIPPTAGSSSAKPIVASVSSSLRCNHGKCGTIEAKLSPFAMKISVTAQRARCSLEVGELISGIR